MRGVAQYASFKGTFSHVANPDLVGDIDRLMLFATPFKELVIYDGAGRPMLPTKAEVAKHVINDGDREALIQRYEAMANVLDITVAQYCPARWPFAMPLTRCVLQTTASTVKKV
jgi:hypothetical protein